MLCLSHTAHAHVSCCLPAACPLLTHDCLPARPQVSEMLINFGKHAARRLVARGPTLVTAGRLVGGLRSSRLALGAPLAAGFSSFEVAARSP